MRLSSFRYGWRQAAGDLSGGLIAALIALPYGLAMAALMGLPPATGLFTSLISAPVTAVLGRNPVLIGGPSAGTVPFIAAAVQEHGQAGAAKVVLAAAVFLLVFSTLRLGQLAGRVPHSVVSGFSCGIGAMMVITQLRTVLGLESLPSAGTLLEQLARALRHIGDARWQPVLLAAVAILVSTVAARASSRLPAPLLGLLAALACARLPGISEAEVGVLSVELPPLAAFQWRPADVLDVLPSACGLAFVIAVNLLLTSRVVDHFRGRRRPPRRTDPDAELGAYGIANILCGIFAAPATVGIPARSIANVRCGGTTRVSVVIHALALLALVSLGSPVLQHLPVAALGGVTIWMGFLLLDWSTWRRLQRMRRVDAAAFLCTSASMLVMNPIAAVAAGCALYVALAQASAWWKRTEFTGMGAEAAE
ncbi:MAG: SulP family inorganic anion transporter [Bryobacteraceae bacterium]|nr:SulP family inorganic anion transporter [Bryobacteraceae bacterium]